MDGDLLHPRTVACAVPPKKVHVREHLHKIITFCFSFQFFEDIFTGVVLFSFCFKICAIKYDYEILLFKELHFAIDKTSMSSVFFTVPISVLAEV